MKIKKYEKWDVHHHIIPDFYVKALEEIGITSVSGLPLPKWSLDKSRKMMKRFNITKAFLSISTPGVWFKDKHFSKNLSRKCNEYIAKIKEDSPDEFGGYASLPLPDVEGAIEEAIYALDVLKLDGVFLMSNVDGHYLGNPSYKPLFEELDKRNATVFIHVNTPPDKNNLNLLNPFYWWFIDTTKTLIDMIKSGYHREYPNIKYIAAHGAGVFPAIYPKLIETMKSDYPNIEEELLAFKNQLYLDTAKTASDEALPTVLNFNDTNHVLFGSDYIWAKESNVNYWINHIQALDLPNDRIGEIFKDNAKILFENKLSTLSHKTNYPKKIYYGNNTNVKYHYHIIPQEVMDKIKQLNLPLTIPDEDIWNNDKTSTLSKNNKYETIMLSLDMDSLWQLDNNNINTILRTFNNSLSKIIKGSSQKLRGLGAIDMNQPQKAIEEIDYCLETLALDGICLYVNANKTPVDQTLNPKLLEKLSQINKPIMIHPKSHSGILIDNEGYLDATYFVTKIFYSNEIEKLENANLILTHTEGSVEFLADNIGILYYLQYEKWHMIKYLFDFLIKKNHKGKEFLRKVIIED